MMMTKLPTHTPTVSQLTTPAVPRFGVSFHTKYDDNLSANDLQGAQSLQQTLDLNKATLDAIPDQIDPLRVFLKVRNREQIQAEVKTQHNGSIILEKEGPQTRVQTFFNDLLSKLTQGAAGLKTLEARQQDASQESDALVLKVFKALQSAPNPEVTQYSAGLVQRYHIKGGKSPSAPSYTVNVSRDVNHMGDKTFYLGIIDSNERIGRNDVRRYDVEFSISTSGQPSIKYSSPCLKNLEIAPEKHGQASVDTLKQRLQDLVDVLEKKKSIESVVLP
jgi:hypothetical protein